LKTGSAAISNQFTLESADREALSHWTSLLVEELSKQPQFADVTSDLQDEGLQAFVSIDRSTASRLGVSIAAIDNALYDAYGQRLVSTIFHPIQTSIASCWK